MKLLRDRKFVLLAAVLMLGMALAPYTYAMDMHHNSMGMGDCSASAHCLACAIPLPSSTRIGHSLPPSLDAIVSFHIQKEVGPPESHYHPPR